MGIVAYDLQNYDDAERDWLLAAHIFDDIGQPSWGAVVQNELGLLYRDRGQLAAAIDCFEKLIAQREKDGVPDHVGRGLENIGEIMLFQGRLAAAIATFERALQKMKTRVYLVDLYLHLGLAYQAAGALDMAQEQYQKGLDIALEIDRRNALPHVYYRLGDIQRRMGNNVAALVHFEAAAELIEATRTPIKDEGLKISLLGRWQQVYEMLVLHCLKMGDVARAFAWAERARARAFADAVAAKRPQSGQAEQAFPDTVHLQMADVQALLPAGGVLLNYFTTGVQRRSIPLLHAIPAHNPLREHLVTPARTLLFVVGGDKTAVYTCPIDPNHLTMHSPRGHDPERLLQTAVLQHLHQSLVGIAGAAAQAQRLFIVPHGPLHHVPFAALMEANRHQSPHPAATITYAPSATLLTHVLPLDPTPMTGGSCLAVGFNDWGGKRPLRYSEAEAA
ncbi:MAG: tetratricopeptide repeat protein, partial [Anaerolineae bacterium]